MQATHLDASPSATPSEPDWLDRNAYPFQSHSLALPDGRMHYVDEGSGEPVLFVHGTPTWSFEYRGLIQPVRGFRRAIAPDHLGFGLSERPEHFEYTPEAHARALAAFVDRLGLERFALVVHDFGGPIALPLALAQPERISRLVVINSFLWPLDADKALAKNAQLAASELGRMLYRHLNAPLRLVMPSAFFDRNKLTPDLHRQYLSVFPDGDSRERVLWQLARCLLGSGDFYARLWQRREALRGIPALIVWGMQDPAFNPQHLRRWQRALPDAEVLDVGDAGHWPHEEQPQLVGDAVRRFLRAEAASARS
ncbi:MAG TPA: alpha/beta fold hydrolase [Polyangiaceae bacterium]|nr:alpha/beta fold hydrolase [Polyangiaceae bacterium]